MYRIAIPSYKRPDGLKNKTIRTLLKAGYTSADIDIFVSNEEEKTTYLKVLPEYNLIVTNTMGLHNKKNFITAYYDEGQHILSMDDDISKMVYSDKTKHKTLKEVVDAIFNQMHTHGTILGGFFPVGDPRCMRNEWERGLCFILGAMYCYINDKSIIIEQSSAEDAERTIKVYEKYKCVVRCGLWAPTTIYWTTAGGIDASEQDRASSDYMTKYYLSETYPEYVTLVLKKDKYDLKYNLKLKTRYTD